MKVGRSSLSGLLLRLACFLAVDVVKVSYHSSMKASCSRASLDKNGAYMSKGRKVTECQC